MDLTPVYNGLIGPLYWLIPAMIFVAVLKSSVVKGWFGELLVRFSTWIFLSKEQYHAFHNVTLPSPDGTTQIDHIFVSEYGIFVVETKNMKGWIFGSKDQPQWTQKIFKQSFRFQNPLRQNFKHLKSLEAALGLPEEIFHSVVVFVGDSKFKTEMPENVTRGGGVVSYIESIKRPLLSSEQVADAVLRLKTGRLTPSFQTHRDHVRHMRSREDLNSEQKCPRCGSAMTLRAARRGANSGRQFWGCSRFPQCRAVINID